MAKSKQQIYKCEICGNTIEVVHDGGGPLVCCGKPMTAVAENSTDAATEKHVPVIKAIDGGFRVTVGSVNHPMEETHWIEWVELIAEDSLVYRKVLNPGEAPVAEFKTDAKSVRARAYCNLHGLWTS
jgi:superoxide reductase